MTTIRLTNTRTRRKEVFAPLDPSNVRMYVCGPTVYDRAHLGNARPVVVFDTLFRLLRHVYGEDHVTYVRNFTDVDDKINDAAARRQALGDPRPLEELIRERTEETIAWYHADTDALAAVRPTQEPRATEWIGAMIAMIQDLIARGHAYEVRPEGDDAEGAGHVLFRVRSYADYGQLSGRSVDDMISGARVEVAPFKEDPLDFVLWKPSDETLPGWDSPWGRGRPGWHIECSAMAYELLGASFDIHGGGLDLQFPHHENEIAQSRCAHPEGGFAKLWMHNEMLQVEGRKMAKSAGNFFTVRHLLEQDIPGEVIRFVLLGTHYGKPMDWTAKKRHEAEATLRRWHELAQGSGDGGDIAASVFEALADDLNTPLAIARLHEMASDLGQSGDAALRSRFVASARLLGLLEEGHDAWLEGNADQVLMGRLTAVLIRARETAMASKDFSAVDRIKTALIESGVEVRMSKAAITLHPGPRIDTRRLTALAAEEAQ
ncbi:MAG TPA: cysteine--tRNA ligase [Rubellimicrobium sp.]|nr:cysteine--tRNA ligase [Rubellimicrobium sp.]